VRYAEHRLEMAKIAPDQKARTIQREMTAEWLKLAEKEQRWVAKVNVGNHTHVCSQFYSRWWKFGAPVRIKLRTLM